MELAALFVHHAPTELEARWIGHRLAALLGDAHAALDEEGNPAPRARGALTLRGVLVDASGYVALGAEEPGAPAAPEVAAGGRLTPRADVHALGALLLELLDPSEDPELEAAIGLAIEPDPARRRVTCVELEALLGRGVDASAAREALGARVRASLAPRPQSPISTLARIVVAFATAAVVFATGVLVVERWLR